MEKRGTALIGCKMAKRKDRRFRLSCVFTKRGNVHEITLTWVGILLPSHPHLWAIAQELDGELFGVTEHTGPLTDWVQHLIATRENQQAERQRRFAMALDIVRDTTQYDSLVAPDASEMTPEQLGFRYTDSQGETFIAFELKEDFPKFMTRRLGLRAGDSVEFRRYLVQKGIMKTVSKNVRGRSRDSISHALICLSTGCEAGE